MGNDKNHIFVLGDRKWVWQGWGNTSRILVHMKWFALEELVPHKISQIQQGPRSHPRAVQKMVSGFDWVNLEFFAASLTWLKVSRETKLICKCCKSVHSKKECRHSQEWVKLNEVQSHVFIYCGGVRAQGRGSRARMNWIFVGVEFNYNSFFALWWKSKKCQGIRHRMGVGISAMVILLQWPSKEPEGHYRTQPAAIDYFGGYLWFWVLLSRKLWLSIAQGLGSAQGAAGRGWWPQLFLTSRLLAIINRNPTWAMRSQLRMGKSSCGIRAQSSWQMAGRQSAGGRPSDQKSLLLFALFSMPQ